MQDLSTKDTDHDAQSNNQRKTKMENQPLTDCNTIDSMNSLKEDIQLVEGITKYDYGKWSAMFKDKQLCFASSRKTNALLRRARTIKFQQLYKRTRSRVDAKSTVNFLSLTNT